MRRRNNIFDFLKELHRCGGLLDFFDLRDNIKILENEDGEVMYMEFMKSYCKFVVERIGVCIWEDIRSPMKRVMKEAEFIVGKDVPDPTFGMRGFVGGLKELWSEMTKFVDIVVGQFQPSKNAYSIMKSMNVEVMWFLPSFRDRVEEIFIYDIGEEGEKVDLLDGDSWDGGILRALLEETEFKETLGGNLEGALSDLDSEIDEFIKKYKEGFKIDDDTYSRLK